MVPVREIYRSPVDSLDKWSVMRKKIMSWHNHASISSNRPDYVFIPQCHCPWQARRYQIHLGAISLHGISIINYVFVELMKWSHGMKICWKPRYFSWYQFLLPLVVPDVVILYYGTTNDDKVYMMNFVVLVIYSCVPSREYVYCTHRVSACTLSHWGRDTQMDAISQTTFSNAFSWMKIIEFRLKFHWSLFPRVKLTILQQWFR